VVHPTPAEILDSFSDPVVAFDRQCLCTYASKRAAEALGSPPEEMAGRPVFDFLPESTRAILRETCERAWQENQPAAFETRSDSAGARLEYRVFPCEHGASLQWRASVCGDGSAEAHYTRALRESEERFRTLADNISQFAWMADERGWVFWYNQRWYEYTGTTLEEMQGWGWQKVHHPDHIERVVARLKRSFETGEPWEDTFPLRGKDGRYRWFLSRALPIRDSGGRVVRWFGTNTDITGHREAQERLRDSEERFRTLFEQASDPVFLHDDEGRFVDVNQRACESLGYSREELLSMTVPDIEMDFDLDSARKAWEQVPFGGALTLHGHQRRKNGSVFPVEIRLGACLLKGERLYLGLVRDVTEHERSERALRESEMQAYRRLAEIEAIYASAPVGLCVFDTRMRWVRMNQRMAEINGLPIEAHLGKTPREMLPKIGEEVEAILGHILETGEPLLDFEITGETAAAPGVMRSWHASWVPLRGERGEIAGISVATEEVSERKRAEERLKQSSARERARAAELETFMEAVPMVLLIARDPECRRITGNRMAHDLLHLPPGSNLSILAIDGESPPAYRLMKGGEQLPPRDLPLRRSAATGAAVRNFELDLVLEDGVTRHLLGDTVPLLGDDGRPRGAVGAFLDISERKRDEERLRQTQKLESIGLLAGGIAHDFNNLLTGVIGNASLVLEEVGPGPGERIREVIAGAERAAHLTRQLLAYSGKGQFTVREVDVPRAVNAITDLVQFSLPKSVDLSVTAERRVPTVRMDPSQFEQILMNLVINAGEAIGEGNPGRVSVSTFLTDVAHPFLDGTGQEVVAGRYVCIEVSDTGSGIEEEKKSKIFEPFFTSKFTGRGLGLAAVAGILRSLRGGIIVDSKPGQGTTFRVYLPASDRALGEPDPKPGGSTRATVLVVDDERTVRDFIGTVLRKRGYRVLSASDGKEALAVLNRENGGIQAAVLDVVMPLMGANELLPIIRAQQPNIKVLLTSGYSESEARRLCAAFPGAKFIQKPYTAQRISRAFEELLGFVHK
jgi:PAS domain S-box-containing protein